MKTVILTNQGSPYGMKVLNDFLHNRVAIEAVVVVRPPLAYYRTLFGYVRRRVGLVDALYFAGTRTLGQITAPRPAEWKGRPFVREYDAAGVPVRYVRGGNSREMLATVEALEPHLLVLAQTEIIRRELLRIPTIGVLNSHPGILPHYRGIDCAKWAVHNGEFHRVGVTVHWVDEGVDTGRIVAQKVYDFSTDGGIRQMEEELYTLCAELLTQVVSSIGGGAVPLGTAQIPASGKQYFKMPRAQEKQVERTLQQLRAKGATWRG
jgi:methionyl-tRNA formyltransferase